MERRGCRLLLESQEVRQGIASHGTVHTKAARAAFLPSIRQVAVVEGADLDQPCLHRVVSPTEEGLEGLVLACGAVDRNGPSRRMIATTPMPEDSPIGKCDAQEVALSTLHSTVGTGLSIGDVGMLAGVPHAGLGMAPVS